MIKRVRHVVGVTVGVIGAAVWLIGLWTLNIHWLLDGTITAVVGGLIELL